MAKYMALRTLPPLTQEQLFQVGQKVIEVCGQMGGMEWIHSHLSADGRQSFCVFEAPDAAAVRQHAAKAGLPIDSVVQLGADLGPFLYSK